MDDPVRNLLIHLSRSRPLPGRKRIRVSADKALLDFHRYLLELQARHIGKPYQDKYLVSGCFRKSERLKNSAEIAAYCRVHLAVCTKMFGEMLTEMKGTAQKVSSKRIADYEEIIRDFLHDLKAIIEHLERRKNPDYTFFQGAKNYNVMTWEIFRLSRQLAVQSAFRRQSFHLDHKTAQIASVFVLRQALEAKFFRLVGVLIYNAAGSTPKLKHEFHYDFIRRHSNHFHFKNVEFDLLRQIYAWCNEIVHNAYQPLAWQIAFAQALCGRLFQPVSTPPGAAWSINNSVEINNLDAMQASFMQRFASSCDHGIWAVEAIQPEADIKS